MMIEPSMTKILDKIPNRYMIVNIASKRARQIAMEAEERQDILDEKPVSIALREIADGKIEIIERQETAGTSAGKKAETQEAVAEAGAEDKESEKAGADEEAKEDRTGTEA